MRQKLLIIGILFVSLSCGKKSVITKRYKTNEYVNLPAGDINTYLNLNTHFLNLAPAPSSSKDVTSLSGEGQAELISWLGQKIGPVDEFLSKVASPLSASKSTMPAIIDFTTFNKQLNINVEKLDNKYGNRISSIKIKVIFPSKFNIVSCNRLTTAYENVDLGKLVHTNTTSAELTGNVSVVGVGGATTSVKTTGKTSDTDSSESTLGTNSSTTTTNGITGTLSGSNTLAEEAPLRERIVALNVAIVKDTLKIQQQGASGIDVSGNIIADLVVQATDVATVTIYRLNELKTGSVYNAPASIKIEESVLMYPNFSDPIAVKIEYEAIYREITKDKGDKTITESDDEVRTLIGTYQSIREPLATLQHITLIDNKDLKPNLWQFGATAGAPPAQIFNPILGGQGDLVFGSYNDAKNFLLWLKINHIALTASPNIGSEGYKFILPTGAPITQTLLNGLRIFPVPK